MLISFCLLPAAFAQTVTLSGYVKDAASGETVPGAMVYTSDLKTGVNANAYGFYSLTLQRGKHVIKCASLGYLTDSISVNLDKALTQDFLLREDNAQIEAARIFSHSKREELVLPQMGKTMVDAQIARKLPALMGETDIIRVIQMMPGVQTPSEGSTGFSVRGGGTDQNLVLLDGAPIYNSGHIMGFLSMFNSDAVKNAQLYKGDFPASYGGRMSSVLDVTTNDGNINSFGGNASIGLIDSKIFLEGPIVKQKLGFMLAARRTYLDLFFPLFKSVPDGTAMHFYDANAKLNWIIGDRDRISLSAFSGSDLLTFAMPELDVEKMSFLTSNNTQSLRWNHVFSPRTFLNVTLFNTRYDSKIGCVMPQTSFDYLQHIREFGVRTALHWHINSNNTLEAGINASGYVISPGETVPTDEESIVQHVTMDRNNAVQPSFYLQNEQKLGAVTLRYGFRLSTFSSFGPTVQRYFDPLTHNLSDTVRFASGKRIKTFRGLEPRLSASWAVADGWALKAAYSRSVQYIQQAVISVSGSPLDTWFTASPNVEPQISDQVSAGFNHLMLDDALDLSLELFYKHNTNTMDFIDNPGIVIDNVDREGLIRFGKSYASGAELMLKYDFDKWGGWLSYTLSDARYKIPEINDGKPYRSPLNHRHAVNFVLSYDFSKCWTLSTDWVFYSGAPTTYPVGRYKYGNSYVPIYSSRNEDSMPDYHRMDLSLTARTRRRAGGKPWSSEWNLSLYNAYSRHNAWSLAFGYNSQTHEAEVLKVYLFTIIPSISYNINF